jgi:hypothetical protein
MSAAPESSENNTYAFLLVRAVDVLGCAWIWRQVDVTISSMAGLELRNPQPKTWAKILGGALNWIQKGHCEMAIQGDIQRAQDALKLLGAS